MNEDYRVATVADLVEGQEVFCYYVTPTPCAASLGVIVTGPDSQGWADIQTDDGEFHTFNAERLAVLR